MRSTDQDIQRAIQVVESDIPDTHLFKRLSTRLPALFGAMLLFALLSPALAAAQTLGPGPLTPGPLAPGPLAPGPLAPGPQTAEVQNPNQTRQKSPSEVTVVISGETQFPPLIFRGPLTEFERQQRIGDVETITQIAREQRARGDQRALSQTLDILARFLRMDATGWIEDRWVRQTALRRYVELQVVDRLPLLMLILEQTLNLNRNLMTPQDQDDYGKFLSDLLDAITHLGGHVPQEILQKLLYDNSEDVRWAALNALIDQWDVWAVGDITFVLYDPNPVFRNRASMALRQLNALGTTETLKNQLMVEQVPYVYASILETLITFADNGDSSAMAALLSAHNAIMPPEKAIPLLKNGVFLAKRPETKGAISFSLQMIEQRKAAPPTGQTQYPLSPHLRRAA